MYNTAHEIIITTLLWCQTVKHNSKLHKIPNLSLSTTDKHLLTYDRKKMLTLSLSKEIPEDKHNG